MIEFAWDSAKAASNEKKHGISFEEAKSVFYDEFEIQFYDFDSSVPEEDR
ncbi:MAG: BrnT family toxin, partial [Candidatus Sedimenticola sp. (ex Thyasira tokunagai)]